jgi:hypothetical protein
MVCKGVFPAGAGGPADERPRGGCNAGTCGGGAVDVALRVAHAGEGHAAGDVRKIAVGGDADPRTQRGDVVGRERLRQGERGYAVAQRVGAVAELRIVAEGVEIAFQPINQRAGLQVATGLTAAEETVGVGAASSACADHSGVGSEQMGSRVDRAGEVSAAGDAAAVKSDIASGPLIGGCRRRLHRHVGGQRRACCENPGQCEADDAMQMTFQYQARLCIASQTRSTRDHDGFPELPNSPFAMGAGQD